MTSRVWSRRSASDCGSATDDHRRTVAAVADGPLRFGLRRAAFRETAERRGCPSSGPSLLRPNADVGDRLRVCVCLHDQPGRRQIQHRMQRFTQPDVERPRLALHHDRRSLRTGLRTQHGEDQASGQQDDRQRQPCRQRLRRRPHRVIDGAQVPAQKCTRDAPPHESMTAESAAWWSVAMPSRLTLSTGRPRRAPRSTANPQDRRYDRTRRISVESPGEH